MTNAVMIQFLKRGKRYGEYLSARRCFLEREAGEGGMSGRGDQSGQAVETGCLHAELEDLRTAEYDFRIVIGVLYRLEPEDKELIIAYYAKHMTAYAIAADLDISESTFWRRKRKAMQLLRTFLQVV